MFKRVLIASALVATSWAQAQTAAAPAAAPATKKELVAKLLQLQQGGIENMARSLVEQPAIQLMQQANIALQRVPQERREAVARDIEADIRKYAEETVPLARERAVKLAPGTIGPLLEERFSEDELRQVIAFLESPVTRKYQQMGPDFDKALREALVAETRGEIEPKVQTMLRTVAGRLPQPAAAASAPAAKPAPAKKP
jgi:hypothetical protein